MGKILFAALLLGVLLVPAAHGWDGYVTRVLDGDSIRVRRGSKSVEIRLYGIDCPEWKQPYGNKARQYTRRKLYHRAVSVEPRDVDRYGRVVALVRSSGMLINRELVRDGFAWMYPKYCQQEPLCSELGRLQAAAGRRRIGLWRDDHPVSPWQWKRRNKYSGSRHPARKYRAPAH
jgi:endonuclease YncB( thermonuclease family)